MTNRYLHGPGEDNILADEQFTPTQANQMPTSVGSVLWPLTDNLGSVRDIIDTTGSSVVNHITYDAFGKVTGETSPSLNHLGGFQVAERDEESGTQLHDRRLYDPATGRWTSEDPIGFSAGDTNLYRNVGNEPTNYVDPSGLAEQAKPTTRRRTPYTKDERADIEKRVRDAVSRMDRIVALKAEIYQKEQEGTFAKSFLGRLWHGSSHHLKVSYELQCLYGELSSKEKTLEYRGKVFTELYPGDSGLPRYRQFTWSSRVDKTFSIPLEEGAVHGIQGSISPLDFYAGFAGSVPRAVAGGVARGPAVAAPGMLKGAAPEAATLPNGGKLVFDNLGKTWTSPAGVVYGQGSVHGNRVLHVLDHMVPNAAKAKHTVFNCKRNHLIEVIDDAWKARSGPGVLQPNGNRGWVVDMGRVIGTQGERQIQIFVRDGTFGAYYRISEVNRCQEARFVKVCPYCQQDDLWHARVDGVERKVIICAECDTLWSEGEEVTYGTGKNFDTFMSLQAKQANWAAVTRLSKVIE